jgi:DNA-binding GntR family transcriptional regulator
MQVAYRRHVLVTIKSPTGRPPARMRVSDVVHQRLEWAIRSLAFAPGQELREHELAAQLGVSRTPVREAIGRLADAELLVVQPQVGTRVARIHLSAVREAQFARQALEVAALEAVCAVHERDVSSLRRRIEEQSAAKEAGDFDGFFAADDAMHAEVFRLAGFPRLWDLVWRVKADLDRLRRLSAPDAATIDELIQEHAAIVDHVEAGDEPRATTTLRRHAARILELQPQLAAAHPDYFAE